MFSHCVDGDEIYIAGFMASEVAALPDITMADAIFRR